MTESQKTRLTTAFQMLAAGAHRGRRMIEAGASLAETKEHVADLEKLVRAMGEAVGLAAGAEEVLVKVGTLRAKPLSRSVVRRPSP